MTYMGKLFAEPFATLTPSQHAAVSSWAPELMAHALTEEGVPEAADPKGSDENMAIAAE